MIAKSRHQFSSPRSLELSKTNFANERKTLCVWNIFLPVTSESLQNCANAHSTSSNCLSFADQSFQQFQFHLIFMCKNVCLLQCLVFLFVSFFFFFCLSIFFTLIPFSTYICVCVCRRNGRRVKWEKNGSKYQVVFAANTCRAR